LIPGFGLQNPHSYPKTIPNANKKKTKDGITDVNPAERLKLIIPVASAAFVAPIVGSSVVISQG
jgi:hypothetical protein